MGEMRNPSKTQFPPVGNWNKNRNVVAVILIVIIVMKSEVSLV